MLEIPEVRKQGSEGNVVGMTENSGDSSVTQHVQSTLYPFTI